MQDVIEEDICLLIALKRGASKAFEQLFNKYYAILTAYARRFIDIDDAQDAVQDVFISLWEKRNSIQITTSLNAYLFRMVYYNILNKIAKTNAVHSVNERFCRDMEDLLYDEEPFSLEELKSRVSKALHSLPDTYREAFILYRIKGMSCKEIASKLEVSDKLVYYRVQQAIKLLELELKDYLPMALLLFSMNLISDGHNLSITII